MTTPLLIISGPPGAGKTTVSRLVADAFDPSVCLDSDWFWSTIVRGYIEPWRPESNAQNRAVVRSYLAAAATMAAGGFPVVLDALLGPWFLDIAAEECAARDVEFVYVVLRPRLEVALARATTRVEDRAVPDRPQLRDEGPVRALWQLFADLGVLERDVIDNSELDADLTAALVLERLEP